MKTVPLKKHDSRAGQAMIEFVITLIGVLAVVAGLLTIVELNRVDNNTLNEASESAISTAMGSPIASSFTPITDWDTGADGRKLTKDDTQKAGSFESTRQGITKYTAPEGNWDGTVRLDGSETKYGDVRKFNFGQTTASLFGFSKGDAGETIETLPVARTLFGVGETITIRNETYMPATGGLY